jgi:hypothetical protein
VNTPNSTPVAPSGNHPAAGGCGGSGGPGGSSAAVPKHSTVVERLRQRIEGCRRHHVNCENRYQQAQVEQLELERRDTVSLYQRTLEQRAKKSGAGSGKQQHPSKTQQDAEAASAEQRNHTLIMVRAHWGARWGRGRGVPGLGAVRVWFAPRDEVGWRRRVNVNFSQGKRFRRRRYLLICQGCQIWGGRDERERSQSRLQGEEGALVPEWGAGKVSPSLS